MIGPGKYDDAATAAREKSGGAVILMVLEGNHGSGFSVQSPAEVIAFLPDILRDVANKIEGDKIEPTTP